MEAERDNATAHEVEGAAPEGAAPEGAAPEGAANNAATATSGTATKKVVYAHSNVPIEENMAKDMIKRGWPLLIVLTLAGFYWGTNGALSAAFGCAVVLLNLGISAFILSTAARVGPEVLMGAVMIGFFVRMGIVALAVLAVRHQPWVVIMPLGLALVITHLGLFAWEARYMSSSLAAPGLKPTKKVKS